MGQLEGKVALVTGGSAGIGLETARRFAAEGAQVYLTGRRKDVVDAAVSDIDGDVVGVVGDVAEHRQPRGAQHLHPHRGAAALGSGDEDHHAQPRKARPR